MSGMRTLSLPLLAFLFALALVGYSVWDLDQLSGPGARAHYSLAVPRLAPAAGAGRGRGTRRAGCRRGCRTGAQPAPMVTETIETAPEVPPASAPADGTGVLAPWVATGCRIAMGITMAFMLVIMI